MNDYSKQWRGDRGSWLEIEIVGSEAGTQRNTPFAYINADRYEFPDLATLNEVIDVLNRIAIDVFGEVKQ